MAKRVTHYINNKTLYTELVKYKTIVEDAKNSGQEKPPIPKYIVESLMTLATRLSYKANFINYSYIDEMILDGIENAINSVEKFNPDRTNNPFAYFTQIIKNAFIRRILTEQKQAYVKHKNFEYLTVLVDNNSFTDEGIQINNEYSANVVETFEKRLTKVKKDSKIRGLEKYMDDE